MNVFISFMRTAVPAVAGVLLALATSTGVHLDSATVTTVVTGAETAGYYALFRLAEAGAAKLRVSWLRTAAGWLLGWARPPEYPAPVSPPPVAPVPVNPPDPAGP